MEWPISLHRAGLLIPGSQWSAAGFLQPALPDETRPVTRTITLGTGHLIARRLHHLFPTADRPAALHSYGLHGWYLPLETPAECVLLPCFEVARAFFYASGHHVISYCLSQLAIERVCWPLVAPSSASHHTAHYCIAALPLRHAEIRLFAELVFNPHCRQTIQRAHARLAHA